MSRQAEDPAAKIERIQLLLQSLQQEDTKFEHGGLVILVALSPDGKKVATALCRRGLSHL